MPSTSRPAQEFLSQSVEESHSPEDRERERELPTSRSAQESLSQSVEEILREAKLSGEQALLTPSIASRPSTTSRPASSSSSAAASHIHTHRSTNTADGLTSLPGTARTTESEQQRKREQKELIQEFEEMREEQAAAAQALRLLRLERSERFSRLFQTSLNELRGNTMSVTTLEDQESSRSSLNEPRGGNRMSATSPVTRLEDQASSLRAHQPGQSSGIVAGPAHQSAARDMAMCGAGRCHKTIVFSNGIYSGEWLDGKMDGKGTFTYNAGNRCARVYVCVRKRE
jgi:hypothetical protein